MKICFIGSADSSHIAKWCSWFSNRGHEVHLVSLTDPDFTINNVFFHKINVNINFHVNDFNKIICYLLAGMVIKRYIMDIKPDIINVHYASGYGIATALSGVKNYILSIWGSDIYDFPKRSFIYKALLRYSLSKPTYLFSTSKAMANEAAKYTNKNFEITPFGVDMSLFTPNKRTRTSKTPYVIGTVKGLSDKYGIRHILEAVAQIKKCGGILIELRIAGRGPQEEEYHQLAKTLGIDDVTIWLGYISQEQAAVEWANMDIAIIPSESESFGVSAVEAQACGTPVIISDIPGLMEATLPGKTSLVIKRQSSNDLARAILDLLRDLSKRKQMGLNGRKYVVENYSMNQCFEKIEMYYHNILSTT